jgi:hypothetical protein
MRIAGYSTISISNLSRASQLLSLAIELEPDRRHRAGPSSNSHQVLTAVEPVLGSRPSGWPHRYNLL